MWSFGLRGELLSSKPKSYIRNLRKNHLEYKYLPNSISIKLFERCPKINLCRLDQYRVKMVSDGLMMRTWRFLWSQHEGFCEWEKHLNYLCICLYF